MLIFPLKIGIFGESFEKFKNDKHIFILSHRVSYGQIVWSDRIQFYDRWFIHLGQGFYVDGRKIVSIRMWSIWFNSQSKALFTSWFWKLFDFRLGQEHTVDIHYQLRLVWILSIHQTKNFDWTVCEIIQKFFKKD